MHFPRPFHLIARAGDGTKNGPHFLQDGCKCKMGRCRRAIQPTMTRKPQRLNGALPRSGIHLARQLRGKDLINIYRMDCVIWIVIAERTSCRRCRGRRSNRLIKIIALSKRWCPRKRFCDSNVARARVSRHWPTRIAWYRLCCHDRRSLCSKFHGNVKKNLDVPLHVPLPKERKSAPRLPFPRDLGFPRVLLVSLAFSSSRSSRRIPHFTLIIAGFVTHARPCGRALTKPAQCKSRMKPWRGDGGPCFSPSHACDRSRWPRTSLALHFCHARIERVSSSRKWNAIKESRRARVRAKTEEREREREADLEGLDGREREGRRRREGDVEEKREKKRDVRSYRSEPRGLEIGFLATSRDRRRARRYA